MNSILNNYPQNQNPQNQKVKKSTSFAVFYLLAATILIACGIWFNYWLNKVDYSKQEFQVITNEQFDLADLKGYVVYIDFWASWCIPCRQSFPWMQRMRNKYSDKKLRIIAVNLDQKVTDMNSFLDKNKVGFTVVTDPSYSLFHRYSITGIPTSILFDATGKELSRQEGFHNKLEDQYETHIQEALKSLS